MKELGKNVIMSVIISCCVVIGMIFILEISERKNLTLEQRVAHLEKCKDAHRDLIMWLLKNNFVQSGYEIVPETIEVLDGERCEPCRKGWVPLEHECECKHKTIETGRYLLKRRKDEY